MSRFTLRLVTLAALVGAVVLVGASLAAANTVSGSQNSNLTVTASMLSNGADPEVATAGQTVTASGSVMNNTGTVLKAEVSATLVGPDGAVMYAKSRSVTLPRGKTSTASNALTVLATYAPGVYTLTVTATDATGVASSASATITVI
jgi:uncharacterized protein YfaS (alpha-2-macroglobulin family)